jgi:hypothetical protein
VDDPFSNKGGSIVNWGTYGAYFINPSSVTCHFWALSENRAVLKDRTKNDAKMIKHAASNDKFFQRLSICTHPSTCAILFRLCFA